MAPQYSNKQPAGFQNYIQNVAIVGASGSIGKRYTAALLGTGKHNLTALTRADSTNTIPSGVRAVKVDYSKPDTVVAALRGQDALVITLNRLAPPETQATLISAAAEAGVPWVLPNEHGFNTAEGPLMRDIGFWERLSAPRKQIEQLGVSKWIAYCTGFWYEHSLAASVYHYGYDFEKKYVIINDDGTTKIHSSTWDQAGRGMAALLSLKIHPQDEHDKSTHLSQYANNFVYVHSFYMSQRDMFESVLRVTGDSKNDWTVEHISAEDHVQKGKDEAKNGNPYGGARAMYARNWYKDSPGAHPRVDTEILGLSANESMDHFTKAGIEASKAARANLPAAAR